MKLEVTKIYRSVARDHPNRTGAYHPFVFIDNHDEDYFIGAMLTSDNKIERKNYPLDKKYFVKNPRPEKESYFVPNELVKKYEWEPFEEIGQLTNDGIAFVKSKLANTRPISFEDYNRI
jgi:hypothetical protein